MLHAYRLAVCSRLGDCFLFAVVFDLGLERAVMAVQRNLALRKLYERQGSLAVTSGRANQARGTNLFAFVWTTGVSHFLEIVLRWIRLIQTAPIIVVDRAIG